MQCENAKLLMEASSQSIETNFSYNEKNARLLGQRDVILLLSNQYFCSTVKGA